MNDPTAFHGPNAGYVYELYERYRQDHDAVDPQMRAFFEAGFSPPTAAASAALSATPAEPPRVDIIKTVAAARLARIVREMGHSAARIDPLGADRPGDPELSLEHHGLTEADLERLPASVVGGPLAETSAHARIALEKLRQVYSGAVGYEDDHIQAAAERRWLRESIETGRFFATITDDDRRDLLERLTKVDTFEQFLEKVQPYQGQKRFSIEGLDMMVPVLDAIIHDAAHAGTREVVIGMAHRGRLNVLAHVLDKPYQAILAEFPANPKVAEALPSSGGGAHGYTGDVKYHKGYQREYHEDGLSEMPITLAPNPSHLEFVNPAIVGRARAVQERRDQPGPPRQEWKASLAIQIHGDAAFPGQGVVAETLNLSRLKGYSVGGTIHIIANNQVGFTTDPDEGRSTLYASDLAKGFEIPIVHVNADEPEACIAVARMAIAYRETFGKDFLIDLVGYRRMGHNETDEPRFTQPTMYQAIDQHPRLREIWADELERRGLVTRSEADSLVAGVRHELQEAKAVALSRRHAPSAPADKELRPPDHDFDTAVPAERLRAANAFLNAIPEGFAPNTTLEKRFLAQRRTALESEAPAINWAHAEALAFASLLEEATPIRLTGQDAERATFGQRNLVLSDVRTGEKYCPLHALPSARAAFAIHNSPLSETAALGFEYGYSVHAGDTLVLWEAQFGDFANGAQVIIDQFIASGKAKWGQTPSVVLLLPHGYEGAGPEHSSARPERFLQLCAGDNLRVANCTTAAQYFHLLRRQALSLRTDPRPLVILTPKFLLRHPKALSSLHDLATGRFEPALDDPRDPARKTGVTRLVVCSGKVYVDLVSTREYATADHVAILRVEELFPFPEARLGKIAATYPGAREVIWLQEEPKNMGAWPFVAHRLRRMWPECDDMTVRYVGRPEEASPAEGSITAHNAEQYRIIMEAFAPAEAANSPRARRNGHKNGAEPSSTAAKRKSPGTEESAAHAR